MLLGSKSWRKGKYFKHLAVLKLAMVIKGRERIDNNRNNRTGPVISAQQLRAPVTVIMNVSNGPRPRGDSRQGLIRAYLGGKVEPQPQFRLSEESGEEIIASWSNWRIAAILSLYLRTTIPSILPVMQIFQAGQGNC